MLAYNVCAYAIAFISALEITKLAFTRPKSWGKRNCCYTTNLKWQPQFD